VPLTEAPDLTRPSVRAIAGLLAVSAAFELGILSERTRAGLAHGPALNGLPRTPPRSGDYTAMASPKLRSPVSGALQCAESWPDSSQK
jgi:DNA invertase Pin-like site-specific DNA recombinase